MLLFLGIWKYGIRRMPLVYLPMLWSLVFPFGMYAVASFRLSLAAEFAPLQSVAKAMTWVAFGAWIITGMALGVSSWRSFSGAIQSSKTKRN
jgi:hypothetical protein